LPASDVDTAVYTDLAGGSVSGRDQLAEFSAVAYRQPDAGQVRSHAITIETKRAPPHGIYTADSGSRGFR